MKSINDYIGLAGLIIAIIALLHSIYYNLVKIKLFNCVKNRVNKNYPWLYEFEVSNLSNVSVVIKKIEIYDKNHELLTDNGFDPHEKFYNEQPQYITDTTGLFRMPNTFKQTLSDSWSSKPFKREVELFPASREHFSYYTDRPIGRIKVITNKRVHKLRKSQSFFPHFDEDC